MNVLSVFDGMSCGQIALNRAKVPYKNYFASEINKHAIMVTQSNFPETVQLGPIEEIESWNIPDIDLLIGGSPCQGFSNMGKGLNFDDPRSKLFFEFVRLKKELTPKYFLLENVRMKKEHLKIISDLLEVEPVLINSKLVSAQSRPRYYWTNIPGWKVPKPKNILLKDILLKRFDPDLLLGAKHLNRLKTSQDIPKRFSNIDPIIAGCMTARQYANWKGTFVKTKKGIRRLDPIECERLQTVPDNYTKAVPEGRRYEMLGNGWTVDIIANIFKGLR